MGYVVMPSEQGDCPSLQKISTKFGFQQKNGESLGPKKIM